MKRSYIYAGLAAFLVFALVAVATGIVPGTTSADAKCCCGDNCQCGDNCKCNTDCAKTCTAGGACACGNAGHNNTAACKCGDCKCTPAAVPGI